jgi:hypothetical protein
MGRLTVISLAALVAAGIVGAIIWCVRRQPIAHRRSDDQWGFPT